MIGFVVPVKPQAFSKDWCYDSLLLERTARSICGQTSDNFLLMIVYNQKPHIHFEHKNIIYVEYPFPAVLVEEIEDFDSYVKKYYNAVYAERMMDKGKKIHYGCKVGIEHGCTYLMSVDSDDLVSNRLAAFIKKNIYAGKAGWRIKKGYIFEEDSWLIIKKKDIQNINGSTHIVRKDLITIPDFSTNIFWNYCLFEAHGYTFDRIKDHHNETLEDYDLFAVIYILHKNNYSNILQITKANWIKSIIKKIIKGRFLSQEIRREFGLYKLTRQ